MSAAREWWANELYSQFGEDGIALSYFRNKAFAKHNTMDNLETGFYVDVGCHHPFMLSNTWYFYQRGWTGINIDPTPGVKEEFDLLRPLDTNLQLAIAKDIGTATFYSYGRAVANTLDVESVDFSKNPTRITVETQTLKSVLDKYLAEGIKIDFLSVDVEGLDEEVLMSSDWEKYRPSLVIVELHLYDLASVASSRIYQLMSGWGYKMYGWAPPSLIFANTAV